MEGGVGRCGGEDGHQWNGCREGGRLLTRLNIQQMINTIKIHNQQKIRVKHKEYIVKKEGYII